MGGSNVYICRMTTQLRVQSKTAYHHITALGNNRQDIFLDKEDRLFYLDLLETAIKQFKFDVAAYCLMLNHIHMLARFEGLNMDQAMYFIQGKYAHYFNKRHDRTGHLFKRRYDNEIVRTEDYLHEAGRYIHMNPVVDKIVGRPEEYIWSSFREFWHEDYRLVTKESPLVTCFTPGGVFDRKAFHDFTTARRRAVTDPQWFEKPVFAAPKDNSDSLQEAADRNHPFVKTIVTGVCCGFGYWGDIYDSTHRSRARDNARSLALYLLKEALPAWPFERLKRLAGINDRKNVYRVYSRCEARIAFDPGFRHVAADVRAALKGVKV